MENAMSLNTETKIEIWKQAIETQMHFAELSIKMRQIGLTLAGATVALAIVLYRTEQSFSFQLPGVGTLIPVGSVLCFSAALILYAARSIDVGVYHRMLRGAVRFNELYERELDADLQWKTGLTEAISAYSRYRSPTLQAQRASDGSFWRDDRGAKPAGERVSRFYWITIGALFISGMSFWFVENFGYVIASK